MIKKQYSGSARRARNIIWNAAGRYDFDPPFMAFFANGHPDQYFNMIAGLVQKWLDMPRLWDFFLSYEGDRRSDEFDDYLWLGLENCVYEKELKERPILEALRRQRGELFFVEQQQMSRQQMEYQSMPVFTQQEYRWASVCGKRPPLLTPREKKIAEALRFSGDLDTDGVIAAMRDFLQGFFRFTPGDEIRIRKATPLSKLLFRHETKRRDRLLVRAGTGEGDHEKARQQRHAGLGRHVGPGPEDEAYIRAVFGRCCLSDQEMRILENELCVDLLLDASQSRMHSQEVLSAEGFIIAKSLAKLHIPVRVSAFRSIRSYTVLEILKDWKQADCRGLLRYFAGGWNRDGLAVETLGRLDDDDAMRGRQRILLVLTDGSPNDSTPLPSSGLLMEREYEGEAAVKSAQEAVKRLREKGVRVGAVFHGNSSHLENIHRIYGHAYVRIQKANQLAQGVSDLLLMLLREMRTD